MSARWRAANQRNVDPTNMPFDNPTDYDQVVQGYVTYDPSYQTAAYFQGGDNQMRTEAEHTFPVRREAVHTEASRYTPHEVNMDGQGNDSFNMIDREIGGQRGWIDNVPYSTGVTSSDLVENFALRGEQAVIRRTKNPSDRGGPVGTSDYSGRQALQFAMNANQYYPNEASQSDLVKAI